MSAFETDLWFYKQYTVFFRFWAPNSDRFFGLTQANFGANSADFHRLTQIFGNFKQKLWKNRQTEPKSSKTIANIA